MQNLVQDAGALRPNRSFVSKCFGWLGKAIWILCQVLLIAWCTLAIYYSNLPWAGLRLAGATCFAAVVIWVVWISALRRKSAIFIALCLGVIAWWISIAPSHDRPWRPEVAVMPRAVIDGDRVRIMNVRNFDYRSRNDFTVRYEDR